MCADLITRFELALCIAVGVDSPARCVFSLLGFHDLFDFSSSSSSLSLDDTAGHEPSSSGNVLRQCVCVCGGGRGKLN
jgi:hypothetical protein